MGLILIYGFLIYQKWGEPWEMEPTRFYVFCWLRVVKCLVKDWSTHRCQEFTHSEQTYPFKGEKGDSLSPIWCSYICSHIFASEICVYKESGFVQKVGFLATFSLLSLVTCIWSISLLFPVFFFLTLYSIKETVQL